MMSNFWKRMSGRAMEVFNRMKTIQFVVESMLVLLIQSFKRLSLVSVKA